MPVASCTCATEAPRRSARSTWKMRPSVGIAAAASRPATVSPSGSGVVKKPRFFVSMERNALPNASAKLRPMLIASPTDFIVVVSVGSAPGNFSKAKRGILTTT